jgi:hypothetical protein
MGEVMGLALFLIFAGILNMVLGAIASNWQYVMMSFAFVASQMTILFMEMERR